MQTTHPTTESIPKVTRPALRYYGSKWRIGEWVISHFPDHDCYVEPFGGGAAVLLRKAPSPVEVYNDLDSDVVNFFRVLRERPNELMMQIELTPFSRQECEEARLGKRNPPSDPVERARMFYILGKQVQGGPSRQTSSGWRYSRRNGAGNSAIVSWQHTDHLWDIVARLRHVQIEHDEALKVIPRFDSKQTLFYVDPPYLLSTRTHDARGQYQHEMTDDDHRELAERLHHIKGMAVLSGYPSPLYEELYGTWQRICTQTVNNAGKTATECLWLSPAAASCQRQLRMEV